MVITRCAQAVQSIFRFANPDGAGNLREQAHQFVSDLDNSETSFCGSLWYNSHLENQSLFLARKWHKACREAVQDPLAGQAALSRAIHLSNKVKLGIAEGGTLVQVRLVTVEN